MHVSEKCFNQRWNDVSYYLTRRHKTESKVKIRLMEYDELGFTSLHIACNKKAPNQIIHSMIDMGGNDLVMMTTSHKTSIGNTALHYACIRLLHTDVIKHLLNVGGKDLALMVNDYNMTALHDLCDSIKKRKNDETFKEQISILAQFGGKDLLKKKDRNGHTALDIACLKGAPNEIKAMLKPTSLDPPSPTTTRQIAEEIAKLKKRGHGFIYDAFLTHNWGMDEQGRDNHERVSCFNAELKRRGFDQTWFDEERMSGNVIDQMCSGIDNSRFVIVFLTKKYITKVAGEGSNGDDDNCRKEFNYASFKGAQNMIVVVMEDASSDQHRWWGPVKFQIGQELYYSYTANNQLETCVERVVEEMKSRMKQTTVHL